MKSKSLLLVFLILTAFGFAQTQNINDTLPEPMAEDTLNRFSGVTYPGVVPLLSPEKKVSVRMEMGTSIGLGSNSGGMYGIYASPHISYKVSPRLRVNFGARIENSNFMSFYSPFNPYFPEYTQTFESNITRTLVYAEGQYLVNPRLMLNARVYKEVATFGEPQVNPRALNMDAEGVAVGFQYKINDNMHIGAEFSYGKGRDPYNPFYPSTIDNSSLFSPYGINRNDIFDRGGW